MAENTESRVRVVIVGAGFAALAAIKELSKENIDVVLVDRDPYSTFQPFLYQVATGGLNPGDITVSARAFSAKYRRVRFVRGNVTQMDPAAREIELADGRRVPYDYLIISAGVGPNFFGVPGAKEHAPTIYTRAVTHVQRHRANVSRELVSDRLRNAQEQVIAALHYRHPGLQLAAAAPALNSPDP